MDNNTNIDLIRSHMDTIILRTLQNDDKYGLEILYEIKNLSDDLYTVKQPTLYSSLKRLESQGLILSYPGEETKGANRTYYRLTDDGRAFLEADQNQWEFARTIIDKLLSDKQFDKDSEKPFEPADFRPLTKRTKKETEEKVVIKYVEVEKPVYIDRNTGAKIDNYSPQEVQENEEEVNDNNNVAVYDNADKSSIQESYIIKDEIPIIATNDATNEEITNDTSGNSQVNDVDSIENAEYSSNAENVIPDEEFTEEYNNYHVSSTQFTEDDYYFQDSSYNSYSQPKNQINHNDYIDDNIDYVGLIEGVLEENANANNDKNAITNNLFDDFDSEMTMNDLQQALESKNIKLRRYQKSNTVTYYSGKFYYSNKLLRDWSWITYAVYTIFILISYLSGQNAGVMWQYSLGFAVLGLILPIACTIIWSKSPLRKKRNNLTLNNAMLSAIILMIGFLVLILIISFFVAGINPTKPQEYVPAIVIPTCSLVLLPLSVVIYALLFKVKTYHLK